MVLVEFRLASELRCRGRLQRILPVFVGRLRATEGGGEEYAHTDRDGGFPTFPDVEVRAVEERVAYLLSRMPLQHREPNVPTRERTVRGAVGAIFACQGEFLHGGPPADAVARVVKWIVRGHT